ncbi:hypothetical protein D8X55_04975 [Malacoplasma penetrans]|uniref:P35 lipoprotein homolog n=1 Tax=Malacoplasma penetrans (strain HF-2) TaxID=272633 RepID=Q8EVA1_MALP2|nr:P35 family lipoprotein [Malacoplasma penetrans]RXY95994.1 hypothetical protein D8X55_04975 [Malacoplasma penetrans]BAC44457.1 P35 lipoprotein homolog [Malacoplasma penetrans HF-2]
MKIKKIKLLKALAMTGAFGIVATVPVIVSSCSSTSDNNTGGENNNQQTQKVTPVLKDSVSLSGSLSKIYDTTTGENRKTTNDLITEDIKENPENYFTNGSESAVKEAVKNATVTVEGNFTTAGSESPWKELPYLDSSETSENATAAKSWKATTGLQEVTYATNSDQIEIKSLDDLHTKLSVEQTLKDAMKGAGVADTDTTTFTIKNRAGFTNGDLIHVNVEGDKSGTKTQYDLQIPTSDINLSVTDLTIKVEGTNIETSQKTTTNYDFNIGIEPETHYDQGSTTVTAANDAAVTVNKVLQDLSLATDANGTLNNEALIKALGVYNVNFSNPTIAPKEGATTRAEKTYTITLDAKPQSEKYVWSDGSDSNTTKKVTFDVKVDVTTTS